MEYMRLLVAALRGLPSARPPADFKQQVLARWAQESKDGVPLSMAAPALPQVAAAPAPAAVPRYIPPPPTAVPRPLFERAYNFVGMALLAAVFGVGMLFGNRYNSGVTVPADIAMQDWVRKQPLSEVARTALPVKLDPPQVQGPPGQWFPTVFKLTAERPLNAAQVAFQVPSGVQMQCRHISFRHMIMPPAANNEPLRMVVLPARVTPESGWEGEVRWFAQRPGRYPTVVEVRCDGVYQQFPITFEAVSQR